MNRSICSKSSFAACHRANAKTILAVSAISIALLAGFYAGILYASTLMTSENGFEWATLATEANYVICLDDEGVAHARNGVTGQIDYNSANISYVINSAIDALPTTGGCVFIKEGTYTISDTIKVPSNVSLIGAGFGSKLVLAAGSNSNLVENSDHWCGNNNILIANLHLDGNKAENPAEIGGLHFKRVRDSTIQNCWVHDSAFAGLLIEKGGGNVIQGNFVYENRNAGIEGTHENYDIVANNVVYSNQGIPYGYGIDYCTGSRHNVFEGNVCHDNGLTSGGGIALWDGVENTIVSNTLTSNHVGLTVGIPSFGNRTYGNIIMGNMVSNNTGDGAHIEGENNLVSKNTFSFNGGNGVYINGSDTKDIIIEGNRLEHNQGWQIIVTASPSDTVIKNNIIFGNDLISDQGTNTLIKWNLGYNTENSGTATIPAGRTSVSLEHELVSTPTHANLTPKDNLEGRSYWYTTNSTHITIHISSPDASKDHSFDWTSET
ncbi:right-handed parallel beta-helix repeat-containing protein [Candidatus Bathyarchaeota archaeon]|nr:right-handed parallel beta-helix repeat-containing protein [Candidatus Bathyarchaeota archaeon]